MANAVEAVFSVRQGNFILHRVPRQARDLLRAWDAADEYLLDYLAEHALPESGSRVLIVNDSFGALALALHDHHPEVQSDSYLSQQATCLNLAANRLSESLIAFSSSLSELNGVFDLVLIKVPKTLALLEYQLIRLAPHLSAASQVIVAGMIKALSPSLWTVLETIIGSTTTALAKKKARLIFALPEPGRLVPANPYPVHYRLENSDLLISNHANVFSRDRLDIGTRFFLQHLPTKTGAKDIVDLGCGNGLLGLVAAQRNPNAVLHFIDESYMAIASAQDNFQRAFGQTRVATFVLGDGLMKFASASADLILCNPPFHQQNSLSDQTALSMFKQSKRVLRPGGELWVIGNRHLNYHRCLARLFGGYTLIASNAKFVIIKVSQAG